ncbi:MAG: hypothetical protein KDD94_04510 [Calditrichaeota bacterium]|nr:hypothetical protein [Calditrichota bacterium]
MNYFILCLLLLGCAGSDALNHKFTPITSEKRNLDNKRLLLVFDNHQAKEEYEKYFRNEVIHHFNNRLSDTQISLAQQVKLKSVTGPDSFIGPEFLIPDQQVDGDFALVFLFKYNGERTIVTEEIKTWRFGGMTYEMGKTGRKSYQTAVAMSVPYTFWDCKANKVISQGSFNFEQLRITADEAPTFKSSFEYLTYQLVKQLLKSVEK